MARLDKEIEILMTKGERGYSAYELAVQNGYTGTEEEWLNAHLSPDYYYTKSEVDDINTETAGLINNEATARQNADTELETLITTEATTRGNADSALETSIGNEATTRQSVDSDLQSQINAIENRGILMAKLINNVTISGNEGEWIYYDIPVEHWISTGSGLTVSNNKIVIGSGISKIKVSAKANISCASAGVYNYRYFIIKHGDFNNCISSKLITVGESCTLTIPNELMGVSEGNVISLSLTCCKDDIVYADYDGTYITVEVIE